jgi:4-amino-4-deoxy-L-arabinose transferase-like glycosyltransferase
MLDLNRIVHNKKIILFTIFIAFLILFYYSHNLRKVSYFLIPNSTEILDERTNVWVGLSIRSTGVPSAWTDLSIYKDIWKEKQLANNYDVATNKFNVIINQQPVTLSNFHNYPKPTISVEKYNLGEGEKNIDIVQPYLDHPPLGGLILSSMIDPEDKEFLKISSSEFRRTSLILADITFVLLFILSWLVFKKPWAGLITAGIYGFSPTFLLVSRYALLENVLIPLSVLTFIFVYLAKLFEKQKKKHTIFLILASISAGLCILVKIPGIYVLISSLIFLYGMKVPFKKLIYFGIGSLSVGALYLLWGLYLLPEHFLSVIFYQSSARIFSGSLVPILNILKFGMTGFPVDGWWLGGFLSIPLLLQSKELRVIGIASLITFTILLFVGAAGFAWYFMIFIPFMCIGITHLIIRIYNSPTIETLVFFFIIFFMSTLFWGFVAPGYQNGFDNHKTIFAIYRVILVTSALVIFSVPYFINKKLVKKYWPLLWTAMLLICIKLNITSFQFILTNWDNISTIIKHNWGF